MDSKELHPLLDIAQNLVEDHDRLTFDVTLTIEGLVVQGVLISELQYRQLVFKPAKFDTYKASRDLTIAGGPLGYLRTSDVEDLLNKFRQAAQMKYDNFAAGPAGHLRAGDERNFPFIHLENAKIISTQERIKIDYWRGPLEKISSINLGEIKARPPFPGDNQSFSIPHSTSGGY